MAARDSLKEAGRVFKGECTLENSAADVMKGDDAFADAMAWLERGEGGDGGSNKGEEGGGVVEGEGEELVGGEEILRGESCDSDAAFEKKDGALGEVLDISPLREDLSEGLTQDGLSGNYSDTKEMYLYDNSFTVVPGDIGKFYNMRVLKLFSNQVTLLPKEAGKLTNLEQLYVKSDATTLAQLPSLGGMTSLRSLELHQVPARPSHSVLPPDISKLKHLRKLAVCNYSITSMPPEIASLSSLEELDLSFNSLAILPAEISNLKSLTSLNVSNNKLECLPAELSSLAQLRTLDVASNLLTSLQSLVLSSMTSLTTLNAQNNNIAKAEEIPHWLQCNLEGNGWIMLGSAGSPGCESDEGGEVFNSSKVSPVGRVKPFSPPSNAAGEQSSKPPGYSLHSFRHQTSHERLNISRVAEVEQERIADINVERSEVREMELQGVLSRKPTRLRASLRPYYQAENQIEETSCSSLDSTSHKDLLGNGLVTRLGRRQSHGVDISTKSSKRRRWVVSNCDISYKYYRESFCGFEDRLQDGFYDAGRLLPFKTLEEFEKEEIVLEKREVIVVDRSRDEDLDIITSSAMHLLRGGQRKGTGDQTMDVKQRAMMLSLFVSECFGGSDKSLNTTCARLAALGRAPRETYATNEKKVASSLKVLPGCTCGATMKDFIPRMFTAGRGPGVQRNLKDLCEQTLRMLKAQFGSNVIPIGALPYGICRHRAILFKYLCDRAEPVIPCELVRGYLENEPHAWNVVLADTPSGSVRYIVDACTPLDMEREDDPACMARHLPLRSINLPRYVAEGFSDGHFPVPVMHEEIGRGASGAVVYRCSIGDFTLAAKVTHLSPTEAQRGGWAAPLYEVRMLRSLPRHSSLMKFYGHSLAIIPAKPPVAGNVAQELTVFTEYVPGGSLEGLLFREKEAGLQALPLPLAVHVAREVAQGLVVLHQQDIIHRDIKSSNILVDWWEGDNQPPVKICDFSSAISAFASRQHTCGVIALGAPPADQCVGTPRWMAPEVVRSSYSVYRYGMEADIWSFGCVLLELLTLEPPYAYFSDQELFARIQMAAPPRLPPHLKQLLSSPHCSANETHVSKETQVLQALLKIFMQCTEINPKDRPTAEAVAKELSVCAEILSPPSYSSESDASEVIDSEVTSEEVESQTVAKAAAEVVGVGDVSSESLRNSSRSLPISSSPLPKGESASGFKLSLVVCPGRPPLSEGGEEGVEAVDSSQTALPEDHPSEDQDLS